MTGVSRATPIHLPALFGVGVLDLYVILGDRILDYRRMAENGFAHPLGNFADISYFVEN